MLHDKMLAVIADVNAQVAEREELIELVSIFSKSCCATLS